MKNMKKKPVTLTKKQKTLPKALQSKIVKAKKKK